MYVRKVEIKNLRCFDAAELTLRHREEDLGLALPNVTLLLGNNGGGKSTIMRAIALAVLSPILPSSGYAPTDLVRRDPAASDGRAVATVTVHGIDRRSAPSSTILLSARVEKKGDYERIVDEVPRWGPPASRAEPDLPELWEDRRASFFLVGYGATRFVGSSSDVQPDHQRARQSRKRSRYQRVASLFEENVPLAPLSSWLPSIPYGSPRANEVIDLINKLLPQDTRLLPRIENDQFLFSSNGVDVPSGSLSDGFRSYVGWISDLLYHLTTVCPPGRQLRKVPGVVMVDEIDLHLHPEWQREVVGTIARELPNLQFILSSHSPIVAGTLQARNIYVMERGEDGTSSVGQLDERIHGRTADEILVSSYFNLATTRAPGMVDHLQRLSHQAMAGDSDAALAFLQELSVGEKK